jgi:hypothetical protein
VRRAAVLLGENLAVDRPRDGMGVNRVKEDSDVRYDILLTAGREIDAEVVPKVNAGAHLGS